MEKAREEKEKLITFCKLLIIVKKKTHTDGTRDCSKL